MDALRISVPYVINIEVGTGGRGLTSSLNRCLERHRPIVPAFELRRCPEIEATLGSAKTGSVFMMKSRSRTFCGIAAEYQVMLCLAYGIARV